jgi:methenyltetrahydrofolate cyclohydrolase
MALVDRTLAEVLDLLAAREPAPGGGSGAAVTGALAAALTEMAAAFGATLAPASAVGADTGGLEGLAQAGARAAELRVRLLAQAEADTRSYRPVLEALALANSDPDRPARLQAALAAAAEVPLAIAIAAADVAQLAAAVGRAGNAHLLGDATAAAVMAEAAARSAARLVELNLAGHPEDPRLGQAQQAARRAWAARTAALRGQHGEPRLGDADT